MGLLPAQPCAWGLALSVCWIPAGHLHSAQRYPFDMFAGMKRHPHPTGGSCCAQSSPDCAKARRVRAPTVTDAWPPLTVGADGQYKASLHRGQVTVMVLPQFVGQESLRACKHCCVAADAAGVSPKSLLPFTLLNAAKGSAGRGSASDLAHRPAGSPSCQQAGGPCCVAGSR